MNVVPAFRFLTEFSTASPGAETAEKDAHLDRHAEAAARSAASVEARISEAHARGIDSGRAEARGLYEAQLHEEKARLQALMAAEREGWVSREGAQISARLATGLADLEATIAQSVGRILEPFLRDELKRRAVADLLRALDGALAQHPDGALRISGPADLLDAVRRGLADRPLQPAYQPNGECDVRVTLGQTVLETNLRAWIAGIEDAIR